MTNIADEAVSATGRWPPNDVLGRRWRCFIRSATWNACTLCVGSFSAHAVDHLTYGEAFAICEANGPVITSAITDRMVRVTEMSQIHNAGANPSLMRALQDLARTIIWDVHEACGAFDNPDLFYPGVDDIEPVSDDHVRLVIAGIGRELSRETRNKYGTRGTDELPAAPLDKLPWRIQRAIVERRRYRFLQWGIGRAEWEKNEWSLWDVRDDPDWRVPWK